MRKLWKPFCVLCLLCCSLTAHPKVLIDSAIEPFSYAEHEKMYCEGDPGVVTEGFANTAKNPITKKEEAIALAKNEVTAAFDYNEITVYYDGEGQMWMVHFGTVLSNPDMGLDGGDQSVYMDRNGVTKRIVFGE